MKIQNSIFLICILFGLISYVNSGRQKQSIQPLNLNQVHFLSTDLNKNCDENIIYHFDGWFPSWIVEYMKKSRYYQPNQINSKLNQEVIQHVEIVKTYLDKFISQSVDLKKFGNLYLELEVRDLLSKISDILKLGYQNPNDMESNVERMREIYSPQIDDLIQTIADSDLNIHAINQISELFIKENIYNKNESSPIVTDIIITLKQEISRVLHDIIQFYTKPSKTAFINDLSDFDKGILQEFFTKFCFVLSPKDLRILVFEKLIGVKQTGGDYKGEFFKSDLFNSLTSVKSFFTNDFNRDKFVTNYNHNFKLKELHDAANPLHFSWDWMNFFNIVKEEDLFMGRDKIEKDQDTLIQKKE